MTHTEKKKKQKINTHTHDEMVQKIKEAEVQHAKLEKDIHIFKGILDIYALF